MSASDEEEPLVELQIRIAYLEDALQSLSDTTAAQEKRIERLEVGLGEALRRLEAVDPLGRSGGD